MNKKAFIMHPVTWIFIMFIVGIIVGVLAARGVIPVPIQICP